MQDRGSIPMIHGSHMNTQLRNTMELPVRLIIGMISSLLLATSLLAGSDTEHYDHK